jgi:hypothetical protein
VLLEKRHHLGSDVAFIEAVAGRSVRASVGNLMVSPGEYIEPSGFSQYFWFCGQLLKNSRLPLIACAVSGRSANPSPAYSIARADTCSKLIVPQRSSTVSDA